MRSIDVGGRREVLLPLIATRMRCQREQVNTSLPRRQEKNGSVRPSQKKKKAPFLGGKGRRTKKTFD